jgi:hypothetical protein
MQKTTNENLYADNEARKYLTWLIISLFLNLPITITGIVVATLHWNTCGMDAHNSSVSNTLNIWIVVFCSVILGLGILEPLFFWFVFDRDIRLMKIFLIFRLFSIAWWIYGGILIFGTVGEGCRLVQNKLGNYPGFPVWQMGLAVWIVVIGCNALLSFYSFLIRKFRSQRDESEKKLLDQTTPKPDT